MSFKPSLLLHISHPTRLFARLEPLLNEFEVKFLFFQPAPRDSTSLTRDEEGVQKAAYLLQTELVAEPPFNEPAEDREHEHEWHDGMVACRRCFRQGIERAAAVADQDGFDFYSSLLLVGQPSLTREEEELTGCGTSQFLSLEDRL